MIAVVIAEASGCRDGVSWVVFVCVSFLHITFLRLLSVACGTAITTFFNISKEGLRKIASDKCRSVILQFVGVICQSLRNVADSVDPCT